MKAFRCWFSSCPKPYEWYRNKGGHMRAKCKRCGKSPFVMYIDSPERGLKVYER